MSSATTLTAISSVIGIAAGVVRPDFAVLRVAGKEIKRPNGKKMHRAGVAVTFQNPELAEDMTVIVEDAPAATELGLKLAVAPDGKPDAASATVCGDPLITAVPTV